MYKAAIVLALVVCVNAGGVYLDHHVGATAEQTVRGYGGLSSISHQAKNVNSAYSTASAYKTKVTNNAVYPGYAHPVAHQVPAYAAAHPVAHAVGPAYAAAPIAHPAVYAAHPGYAAPHPAYSHPIARALPVAHSPVAAKAGLLGVAYSPVVPGVATLSFDGFGVHYGY